MRACFLALILIGGVTAAAVSSCTKTSNPNVPVPPNTSNSAFINIPKGDAYSGTTNFTPQNVTITVGGMVTWINNDTITHQPTQNDSSWTTEVVAGQQISHTYTAAGVFSFHCAIHPDMTGVVTVKAQ